MLRTDNLCFSHLAGLCSFLCHPLHQPQQVCILKQTPRWAGGSPSQGSQGGSLLKYAASSRMDVECRKVKEQTAIEENSGRETSNRLYYNPARTRSMWTMDPQLTPWLTSLIMVGSADEWTRTWALMDRSFNHTVNHGFNPCIWNFSWHAYL